MASLWRASVRVETRRTSYLLIDVDRDTCLTLTLEEVILFYQWLWKRRTFFGAEAFTDRRLWQQHLRQVSHRPPELSHVTAWVGFDDRLVIECRAGGVPAGTSGLGVVVFDTPSCLRYALAEIRRLVPPTRVRQLPVT